MAQGDFTFFQEALEHIADGTMDLDDDTLKVSLHTSAAAFAAGDTTPNYTSSSGTEVSGTNYTATGATATTSWTEAAGSIPLALTAAITWSQDVAGPDNIYYGLLYSDTATGKDAIGFIDMGGAADISLQDGDITINTGNFFTIAIV